MIAHIAIFDNIIRAVASVAATNIILFRASGISMLRLLLVVMFILMIRFFPMFIYLVEISSSIR